MPGLGGWSLDVGAVLVFGDGECSGEEVLRDPNYQIYLKLIIQGGLTRVFSAETLGMKSSPTEGLRKRSKQAIACHKLTLA